MRGSHAQQQMEDSMWSQVACGRTESNKKPSRDLKATHVQRDTLKELFKRQDDILKRQDHVRRVNIAFLSACLVAVLVYTALRMKK